MWYSIKVLAQDPEGLSFESSRKQNFCLCVKMLRSVGFYRHQIPCRVSWARFIGISHHSFILLQAPTLRPRSHFGSKGFGRACLMRFPVAHFLRDASGTGAPWKDLDFSDPSPAQHSPWSGSFLASESQTSNFTTDLWSLRQLDRSELP